MQNKIKTIFGEAGPASIQGKLVVTYSMIIAVISAFIFVYFPYRLEEASIQSLQEKALSISHMAAFSIAAALYFEDANAMQETMESAKQTRELAYFIITNRVDSTVLSYNEGLARQMEFNNQDQEVFVAREMGVIKIKSPIVLNGEVIGTLYLALSTREVFDRISQSRRTILLVSLFIFVAGIFAVILVSSLLTRPLAAIARAARQISAGNFSVRVEVEANDETGTLSKAFNHMAAYVDQSRKELTAINQKLEHHAHELEAEVEQRRKAEAEQARLLKKIEGVNKELKDFAYIVSHDLKAPLRSIGSLATWLESDHAEQLNDEGLELIHLLKGRVERMQNLIDGVLQYSRLGRIRDALLPVDLEQILPDVIEFIAPPEHIHIGIDTPLPTVTAEKIRLEQVFQNLLSNAVKYMDKPRGEVKIGCSDEDDFWKFWVRDNGPGIEEKHFDKIFQIFQTLNARDDYESTGVGLTLIKKIIEMYGGQIWLESTPGEGTTFFFTLPKEPLTKHKDVCDVYSEADIAG